ncbi:MAG: type II toxin-antitoxin system VapC family toxin [Geodermatophilaceae bacterium]
MIVLDTNVLSELTRQNPDPAVRLGSLPVRNEVVTTAVTAAELLYGTARLPPGRRRDTLTAAIRGLLDEDLHDRVEPFELIAASHYADLVSARERVGRPISVADAQIAAICRRLHALLATRNTADFEHAGVQLVNPWQHENR